MDQLVPKTVTLSNSHIEHGKKVAGNLSRYIRTLIDRDIGEQKGKLLAGGDSSREEKQQHKENDKDKDKKQPITWNFPSD